MMLAVALRYVGAIQLTDDAWSQACLSITRGGFGLPSLGQHSPDAYIVPQGSVQQTWNAGPKSNSITLFLHVDSFSNLTETHQSRYHYLQSLKTKTKQPFMRLLTYYQIKAFGCVSTGAPSPWSGPMAVSR